MTSDQSKKILLQAKYNPTEQSNTATHQAITDSGATDNMTSLPELFEEIISLDKNNFVILGDDIT